MALVRSQAVPILHPVSRVQGAYVVAEPGRPLHIIWPSGLVTAARAVPVRLPNKERAT
jgi:hypothetical protein